MVIVEVYHACYILQVSLLLDNTSASLKSGPLLKSTPITVDYGQHEQEQMFLFNLFLLFILFLRSLVCSFTGSP